MPAPTAVPAGASVRIAHDATLGDIVVAGNGQVTSAGHLPYFFAGDQTAGQANGLDVAGWHAVSPAGMLVGH
jgi:hypothetical protein